MQDATAGVTVGGTQDRCMSSSGKSCWEAYESPEQALSQESGGTGPVGPPLHLACDRVPHEDILNRRFEIRRGLFGVALLALSRGPFDPATLGAGAASAPDLEHVFPQLRARPQALSRRSRLASLRRLPCERSACPGGRDSVCS